MYETLNLISLNINGLNKKVVNLLGTLKQNSVDICLVTETHKTNISAIRKLQSAGYTIILNTLGSHAGTAIIY